jgi:hypothetical protein
LYCNCSHWKGFSSMPSQQVLHFFHHLLFIRNGNCLEMEK